MTQLNEQGLNLLFREARTHNAWQDRPVDDALLRAVYDLAKMGPTSANMSPMRVAFVKSAKAKERLKPALDAGNLEKTMTAPVVAILGMDTAFYNQMTRLFPHKDLSGYFKSMPESDRATVVMRNGSLQAAYFMLAARALGLDCGPMSGFDNAKVDAEFFGGTSIKSNFLCNLGYGNPAKLFPRLPRLGFDEVCSIL